MVKTAGRRSGRKKNYGLTVTLSSKPWCPALEFIFVLQSWTKHNLNDFAQLIFRYDDSVRDPQTQYGEKAETLSFLHVLLVWGINILRL
jgi:hypothetical protein